MRLELRGDRPPAQQSGQGHRPRPPESSEDLPPPGVKLAGSVAHVAAGETRGVAGPDDGADGRAGNHGRADAELVEGLADQNMGHTAGAAAAKRKSDTQITRHALPLDRGMWRDRPAKTRQV